MSTHDFATAVLIAAFNAEATLDRAVASALAQPEAAEICIVDDQSRDATAALAEAWAERDARVRVLRLPANAGPAQARNLAIAATRSPWLAVLDADDYYLPGRLAALHAHAADADFVADTLQRCTETRPPQPPSAAFAPAPMSFETFVLGNLGALGGPLDLGFLKPLMRRQFLDRHGLTYQATMRLGEDYDLYARALALGARFVVGGEAGYASVERAGSLSKEHSETDLQKLRDCDDAIALLRPLSTAEQRALKRHWRSVDCRLQWRRLITAVKTHDTGAALSTFHSPAAALYLATRLGEQAVLRSTRGVRTALHL